MDGWMDGYKKMKKRWMVGWIKIYEKIWMVDGWWMDRKKVDGWMDVKIYEKNMDGWMDKKMKKIY